MTSPWHGNWSKVLRNGWNRGEQPIPRIIEQLSIYQFSLPFDLPSPFLDRVDEFNGKWKLRCEMKGQYRRTGWWRRFSSNRRTRRRRRSGSDWTSSSCRASCSSTERNIWNEKKEKVFDSSLDGSPWPSTLTFCSRFPRKCSCGRIRLCLAWLQSSLLASYVTYNNNNCPLLSSPNCIPWRRFPDSKRICKLNHIIDI